MVLGASGRRWFSVSTSRAVFTYLKVDLGNFCEIHFCSPRCLISNVQISDQMNISIKSYGPNYRQCPKSFLSKFYLKCAFTLEYFQTYKTYPITSTNIFISTLTIYIVHAYIITYISISKIITLIYIKIRMWGFTNDSLT